jgi:hypothetical protein
MMVDVMNLSTGEVQVFVGIEPKLAVIAAYAQSLGNGDYNTWDYAAKYSATESKLCFVMGDFSAYKDGRRL